jgi:hypothetical protein
MKYSFYKKEIKSTNSLYFLVKAENSPVEWLEFRKSTYQEIDEIIEGVTFSKTSDEDYEYQTEDDNLYIISNKKEVEFYDMSPLKLGEKEVENASLVLTHDEFIKFLNDFKNFITANL